MYDKENKSSPGDCEVSSNEALGDKKTQQSQFKSAKVSELCLVGTQFSHRSSVVSWVNMDIVPLKLNNGS